MQVYKYCRTFVVQSVCSFKNVNTKPLYPLNLSPVYFLLGNRHFVEIWYANLAILQIRTYSLGNLGFKYLHNVIIEWTEKYPGVSNTISRPSFTFRLLLKLYQIVLGWIPFIITFWLKALKALNVMHRWNILSRSFFSSLFLWYICY